MQYYDLLELPTRLVSLEKSIRNDKKAKRMMRLTCYE